MSQLVTGAQTLIGAATTTSILVAGTAPWSSGFDLYIDFFEVTNMAAAFAAGGGLELLVDGNVFGWAGLNQQTFQQGGMKLIASASVAIRNLSAAAQVTATWAIRADLI